MEAASAAAASGSDPGPGPGSGSGSGSGSEFGSGSGSGLTEYAGVAGVAAAHGGISSSNASGGTSTSTTSSSSLVHADAMSGMPPGSSSSSSCSAAESSFKPPASSNLPNINSSSTASPSCGATVAPASPAAPAPAPAALDTARQEPQHTGRSSSSSSPISSASHHIGPSHQPSSMTMMMMMRSDTTSSDNASSTAGINPPTQLGRVASKTTVAVQSPTPPPQEVHPAATMPTEQSSSPSLGTPAADAADADADAAAADAVAATASSDVAPEQAWTAQAEYALPVITYSDGGHERSLSDLSESRDHQHLDVLHLQRGRSRHRSNSASSDASFFSNSSLLTTVSTSSLESTTSEDHSDMEALHREPLSPSARFRYMQHSENPSSASSETSLAVSHLRDDSTDSTTWASGHFTSSEALSDHHSSPRQHASRRPWLAEHSASDPSWVPRRTRYSYLQSLEHNLLPSDENGGSGAQQHQQQQQQSAPKQPGGPTPTSTSTSPTTLQLTEAAEAVIASIRRNSQSSRDASSQVPADGALSAAAAAAAAAAIGSSSVRPHHHSHNQRRQSHSNSDFDHPALVTPVSLDRESEDDDDTLGPFPLPTNNLSTRSSFDAAVGSGFQPVAASRVRSRLQSPSGGISLVERLQQTSGLRVIEDDEPPEHGEPRLGMRLSNTSMDQPIDLSAAIGIDLDRSTGLKRDDEFAYESGRPRCTSLTILPSQLSRQGSGEIQAASFAQQLPSVTSIADDRDFNTLASSADLYPSSSVLDESRSPSISSGPRTPQTPLDHSSSASNFPALTSPARRAPVTFQSDSRDSSTHFSESDASPSASKAASEVATSLLAQKRAASRQMSLPVRSRVLAPDASVDVFSSPSNLMSPPPTQLRRDSTASSVGVASPLYIASQHAHAFDNIPPTPPGLVGRDFLSHGRHDSHGEMDVQSPSAMAAMREIEESLLANQYIVKFSDLTLEHELGRGSFGVVYKGRLHGSPIAVKRLLLNMPEKLLKEFNAEVSVMRRLHHPNVILFIGATVSPDPLCIITEYVSKGTLDGILNDDGQVIDPNRRLRFSLDIARGMSWLHHYGIIHSDLKPTNILVSENDNCKVGDFGLSKMVNYNRMSVSNTGGGGTVAYTAPEVIRGERLTVKVDVYAYAICMWQIITRSQPYSGMHSHAVCFAVVARNMRPPVPQTAEEPYLALMINCWAPNPSDRPDFDSINTTLTTIEQNLLTQNDQLILMNSSSLFQASPSHSDNPTSWTGEQVAVWLDMKGYSAYINAFMDAEISGRVLLTLTEADLKGELGVASFGKRRELLLDIDELRQLAGQLEESIRLLADDRDPSNGNGNGIPLSISPTGQLSPAAPRSRTSIGSITSLPAITAGAIGTLSAPTSNTILAALPEGIAVHVQQPSTDDTVRNNTQSPNAAPFRPKSLSLSRAPSSSVLPQGAEKHDVHVLVRSGSSTSLARASFTSLSRAPSHHGLHSGSQLSKTAEPRKIAVLKRVASAGKLAYLFRSHDLSEDDLPKAKTAAPVTLCDVCRMPLAAVVDRLLKCRGCGLRCHFECYPEIAHTCLILSTYAAKQLQLANEPVPAIAPAASTDTHTDGSAAKANKTGMASSPLPGKPKNKGSFFSIRSGFPSSANSGASSAATAGATSTANASSGAASVAAPAAAVTESDAVVGPPSTKQYMALVTSPSAENIGFGTKPESIVDILVELLMTIKDGQALYNAGRHKKCYELYKTVAKRLTISCTTDLNNILMAHPDKIKLAVQLTPFSSKFAPPGPMSRALPFAALLSQAEAVEKTKSSTLGGEIVRSLSMQPGETRPPREPSQTMPPMSVADVHKHRAQLFARKKTNRSLGGEDQIKAWLSSDNITANMMTYKQERQQELETKPASKPSRTPLSLQSSVGSNDGGDLASDSHDQPLASPVSSSGSFSTHSTDFPDSHTSPVTVRSHSFSSMSHYNVGGDATKAARTALKKVRDEERERDKEREKERERDLAEREKREKKERKEREKEERRREKELREKELHEKEEREREKEKEREREKEERRRREKEARTSMAGAIPPTSPTGVSSVPRALGLHIPRSSSNTILSTHAAHPFVVNAIYTQPAPPSPSLVGATGSTAALDLESTLQLSAVDASIPTSVKRQSCEVDWAPPAKAAAILGIQSMLAPADQAALATERPKGGPPTAPNSAPMQKSSSAVNLPIPQDMPVPPSPTLAALSSEPLPTTSHAASTAGAADTHPVAGRLFSGSFWGGVIGKKTSRTSVSSPAAATIQSQSSTSLALVNVPSTGETSSTASADSATARPPADTSPSNSTSTGLSGGRSTQDLHHPTPPPNPAKLFATTLLAPGGLLSTRRRSVESISYNPTLVTFPAAAVTSKPVFRRPMFGTSIIKERSASTDDGSATPSTAAAALVTAASADASAQSAKVLRGGSSSRIRRPSFSSSSEAPSIAERVSSPPPLASFVTSIAGSGHPVALHTSSFPPLSPTVELPSTPTSPAAQPQQQPQLPQQQQQQQQQQQLPQQLSLVEPLSVSVLNRPSLDEFFVFACKLVVHLSFALQRLDKRSRSWENALLLKSAFDIVLYREGVYPASDANQQEQSLDFKDLKADGFVEVVRL